MRGPWWFFAIWSGSLLALVGLLIFGVSACDGIPVPVPPPYVAPAAPAETGTPMAQQRAQERKSGGIGMTYTGKIGIEVAPGIVMPFSGGVGLGFGL